MLQDWLAALVLICLVAILIYGIAARKRHGRTPDELKKPEAIRRGKYINKRGRG